LLWCIGHLAIWLAVARLRLERDKGHKLGIRYGYGKHLAADLSSWPEFVSAVLAKARLWLG
jgi:hypothetical protein